MDEYAKDTNLSYSARKIFKKAEAFLKISLIILHEDRYKVDGYGAALISAAFANHALACELYFKCIYYLENGNTNAVKGKHHLNSLFEKLSPEARARIRGHYDSISDNHPEKLKKRRELGDFTQYDLEAVLTEAKKAFTNFRYSHEEGVTQPHYRLYHAVFAIRRYIFEIHPHWANLVQEPELRFR